MYLVSRNKKNLLHFALRFGCLSFWRGILCTILILRRFVPKKRCALLDFALSHLLLISPISLIEMYYFTEPSNKTCQIFLFWLFVSIYNMLCALFIVSFHLRFDCILALRLHDTCFKWNPIQTQHIKKKRSQFLL